MQFFQLPHVGGEHTLGRAFELMRAHDRRAVVVELETGVYRLFSNHEIAGWIEAHGEDTRFVDFPPGGGAPVGMLGDLSRMLSDQLETTGRLSSIAVGVDQSYQGEDLGILQMKLQRSLDLGAGMYFLVAPTRGVAVLVSQHEGGTDIAYGEKACICRPNRHRSKGERDGDDCDLCSGTYECA